MWQLTFQFSAVLLLGAALGAMACYAWRRARNGGPAAAGIEFIFVNKELVAACQQGQRALSYEDLDEDVFHQLIDRLSPVFPDLGRRIESIALHRDAFVMSEATKDGPATVKVSVDGSAVTLRITGIPAPLARKALVDSDKATAAAAELDVLRAAMERAPHPAWRETTDGRVDWANKAYMDLANRADVVQDPSGWPPARMFHGGTVTAPGAPTQTKRSSLPMTSGGQMTFEVTRFGLDTGTLNFAVDAGATVQAEQSLRQFRQTLTQTFASLPIGLAIFDRSRSLVMFNPALVDLTNLEPQWLSARPTLYDLLNQLREKRMVPERRDFADWRTRLAELEKSAADGTYCDTWTLPTGQTYRVTGRPHPEGAVAFLIEDITAEMTLTRKFRRELSMNQALLDQLPDALVVFGVDGVITTCNAAYHDLWGTDPENALNQLTVADATRLWQSRSSPTPVWGDARDFVTQRGERAEWSDTVTLANGRIIQCRFQPMTGGATMVEFSNTRTTIAPPPRAAQLAAVSS